jgi:hypothetical protein
MTKPKTTPTAASVEAFLNAIADDARRQDCLAILEIMKRATAAEPKMWGPSIVGFGNYHYKYESGREGDWFLTGFSPRKRDLTLYIMAGFERYDALMEKLGEYKTGKSCLYVKRLADIEVAVLTQLIQESVDHMRRVRQ